MSRECEHLTVRREGMRWFCSQMDCKEEFMVLAVVQDHIEDKMDDVVAVASAMLWDFHERAVEKYGPDVAEAVAPKVEGRSMLEFTPDTCPHHEFIEERCVNCGSSMFLDGKGT